MSGMQFLNKKTGFYETSYPGHVLMVKDLPFKTWITGLHEGRVTMGGTNPPNKTHLGGTVSPFKTHPGGTVITF